MFIVHIVLDELVAELHYRLQQSVLDFVYQRMSPLLVIEEWRVKGKDESSILVLHITGGDVLIGNAVIDYDPRAPSGK